MADADTTTETGQEPANDVKIEDVGPALKRISITIPTETIELKLQEQIGAVSSEAVLPGFRRGKAPRRLLERRFGSSIRDETKNRLIADAYAKAVEDNNLKPVGEPEPTEPADQIKLEQGKPLEFSVQVEVVPEFELPDLEGIEIKRPRLEIADEHIDDRVSGQQHRLGEVSRVDSGFVPGDRLVGRVSVTKEGETEPLFQDDQSVIVYPGEEDGGRGPVLGLMIDGLDKMIEGKRVGGTLTIETEGPEAHEREDLRGAKLTITYQITGGEHTEPASLEKLVEIFGTGTVENLRGQMRLALQHQRDQEQATAMRDQLYHHLMDTVEMDVPEKLTASQAARTLEGKRLELMNRGFTAEEIEPRLAELRNESETEAQRRLKLFFLLHRLGQHFNIDVTEQEMNGRIATMAAQQGLRPDHLRSELDRQGRHGDVARMIHDEKTADRIIAKASVSEISAEEWNKLMTEGGPAAAAGTKKKKKTSKKTAARTGAAAKGGKKKKTRSKK